MTKFEVPNGVFSKLKNKGMSQPLLNTKPITQHGAVKAVNLFGSYIKETLTHQFSEKSAVERPQYRKSKGTSFLGSFSKTEASNIDNIKVAKNGSFVGITGTTLKQIDSRISKQNRGFRIHEKGSHNLRNHSGDIHFYGTTNVATDKEFE